jgi:hypothetical protein
MFIEYNNQSIELNPDKEIILSLSGGLDSASLLFLILKHFPETTIWPICGKDLNAPFDAECALDIIEYFNNLFPDIKLNDLHIFEFNDRDPELLKRAQYELDNGINTRSKTAYGAAKNIATEEAFLEFSKLHPDIKIYEAMTQNPPIKDMKDLGFYNKALRNRDPDSEKSISPAVERPYINVDKKFVADVYYKNDIQDLIDLTNSCTGTAKETNGFMEPCKKCFWCYEKYWAFGRY